SAAFNATEVIGSTLFALGGVSYFISLPARRLALALLAVGVALFVLYLVAPGAMPLTILLHNSVLLGLGCFGLWNRDAFRRVSPTSYKWLLILLVVALFAGIHWAYVILSAPDTVPVMPFIGTTAATVFAVMFFVHLEHSSTVTHLIQQERHLEDSRTQLERVVHERTVELARTNTDLYEANAALERRMADLEEAMRVKSEFLAAMSHELRTPLNSIIGFTGVVLQGHAGPLTDEQKCQLGMVRDSGQHLLALINQVLELSRLENAEPSIVVEDLDIGAVVRRVAETLRPLAAGKGLEMTVCVDSSLPPIRTDRLRLDQIFYNLVGNAIKFTERGHISISVKVAADGDVRFSVADTGIGIAPGEHSNIFEDFYQVIPANGGKAVGTGLGLPISQRLAESLGGTIELEAGPVCGSVFTLILSAHPLTPDDSLVT
ncbi:MAG: ATP-binding protein, partial [Actinomycetota bacterium]|nr:ATP-binding protein [Actinomycetota bacterium]